MNVAKLQIALLCLCVVLLDAGVTHAQLFGQRTLGGTLSRRPRPGFSGEGAGTLTGNERFIRGNREAGDFVGTDAADTPRFIGLQQGRSRGPIRSAITGLSEVGDQNVNQPQPQTTPADRPYAPRLQLGFEMPAQPVQVTAGLAQRVQMSLSRQTIDLPVGSLRVSLHQRTAILQGEVASEHARLLAEQLVLLEPGVSQVQNELRVVAAPENPGASPSGGAVDTLPSPLGDTTPTQPDDR
mgnify:CR=1 FL=1